MTRAIAMAFSTPLLALALAGTSVAAAPPTPTDCLQLRLHGQSDAATSCFTTLAQSADPYLAAEGEWGLGDFVSANNSFRTAVARDPRSAHDRVRWGLLLHERFNNTDAEGLFKEALGIDPQSAEAYLGLALVSADGFDEKAEEYANKAAALDPHSAEAQELLATLALQDSDTEAALSHADAALALAPDALDAMAIHTAVEVLSDRSPQTWLDKITAVNPHYGRADEIIGDQLILQRRYSDGVDWYRKAVALSPDLWPAHEQLGINLLRLGQSDAARQELELCYNHDYRDAATVNSLRLLDSYSNFVYLDDNDNGLVLRLMMNKKEAALLQPYFDDILRKAVAHYEQEYHYTPPSPVQVEVYPDHEDFAVRTYGMPGLGALGVTFGSVVAMDSPSGRPPGDFNWATTLWHETDHVFVLNMTHHRVPRWFAEGLAVHEETLANPEWGDPVTPEILQAVAEHKLLPIERFDAGFIRPTYDGQVQVSYFQAGKVCDYIYAHWGNQALNAMIADFAQPTTTDAVVQKELGLTAAAFDTQFDAWLDQQLGTEVTELSAWKLAMQHLSALAEAKQYADMVPVAESAIKIYPDYVYAASAYEFEAEAHLAQNDDVAGAVAALTGYEHHGGRSPATLEQLAKLEEQLGQPAAAAATLDRVNYIDPVDAEAMHQHLGDLWMQLKNYPGAIREYAAVTHGHPVDVAGANFNLARAYFSAGQIPQAEDSVLKALETAPDYRPAQQLLLEIESKKGS